MYWQLRRKAFDSSVASRAFCTPLENKGMSLQAKTLCDYSKLQSSCWLLRHLPKQSSKTVSPQMIRCLSCYTLHSHEGSNRLLKNVCELGGLLLSAPPCWPVQRNSLGCLIGRTKQVLDDCTGQNNLHRLAALQSKCWNSSANPCG